MQSNKIGDLCCSLAKAKAVSHRSCGMNMSILSRASNSVTMDSKKPRRSIKTPSRFLENNDSGSNQSPTPKSAKPRPQSSVKVEIVDEYEVTPESTPSRPQKKATKRGASLARPDAESAASKSSKSNVYTKSQRNATSTVKKSMVIKLERLDDDTITSYQSASRASSCSTPSTRERRPAKRGQDDMSPQSPVKGKRREQVTEVSPAAKKKKIEEKSNKVCCYY